MLPYSEACERNKGPILTALGPLLGDARKVLEIGSGTGQHAVWFAGNMDWLTWQPSELPEWLPRLAARLEAEAPVNLAPPLCLDVREHDWSPAGYDAVFTANTLHIMHWPAVQALFARMSELSPGAWLCVYGPFAFHGRHTSASNIAFDRSLRARDPGSGVRDVADLDRLASAAGLRREHDIPLPANNRLLAWRRAAEEPQD
ncbi:MAG: DUF938 domain-containing protein [Chromatiales bacterium]|nr:DUF938 domain-containing protein [Chromatiales bacterium]